MEFTPEQVGAIKTRVRVLRMKGQPEIAFSLLARLKRGDPIEPWEYDPEGVRPEKGITAGVVAAHPPFTGPGSGGDAWKRWAISVADVEPQIIENLGRDAVIQLLRDRGILPPAEPQEGEPSKPYKPRKRAPKGKKG